MIFWAPKGLHSFASPALPYVAHLVWQAHICCWTCWPSYSPVIANMPGSPLQLGTPLFSDYDATTGCQISASLHDPFNLAHAVKPNTTWEMLTHYQVLLLAWDAGLVSSGPQSLCADLEEVLPRRFRLNRASLLLISWSSPQLTGIDRPNKAKVSCQWCWPLAHSWFFSPSCPEITHSVFLVCVWFF